MTDLPQLHADLVAAGRRRRRRRRVAQAASGAVAAAAVAVALTGLDGVPEEEVPAPATVSERLERAYGVFRRPARPRDRFHGRLAGAAAHDTRVLRSRQVARLGARRYFLVETTGGGLCLMSPGAGGGCGPTAIYLDGKRPIGSFSDEEGPAPFVFAFPDGVEEVVITTSDGHVEEAPVVRNAVARRLRARIMRLRWTAPDGTPQKIDFQPAPAFDPADFYTVLERGDEVVTRKGGAKATIASRDGRLCLRLDALGTGLEGCRRKVADVRRGLVVVVGRGERRALAGAFAEHIRSVQLRFVDGARRTVRVRDNVLIVPDASDLVALRYRAETDQLPASARSVVLNADP